MGSRVVFHAKNRANNHFSAENPVKIGSGVVEKKDLELDQLLAKKAQTWLKPGGPAILLLYLCNAVLTRPAPSLKSTFKNQSPKQILGLRGELLASPVHSRRYTAALV